MLSFPRRRESSPLRAIARKPESCRRRRGPCWVPACAGTTKGETCDLRTGWRGVGGFGEGRRAMRTRKPGAAAKPTAATPAVAKPAPAPRLRREVDPMFRIALMIVGVVTFLRLLW